MIERVDWPCVVETCDVADGNGAKIPSHRVKANVAGEPEMTVFVGGDSGTRAAAYARARYRSATFVMHADPLKTGILGGSVNGGDNGRSDQI